MAERARCIAIVGAGAVGCYYGGRLAEHGHDVHFVMRSDYDVVMQAGLHITSPLGDAHLQVQAYRSPQEIGPCDLVVISLKATSNPVLLEILPTAGDNGFHDDVVPDIELTREVEGE